MKQDHPADSPPPASNIFLARQPIFDTSRRVIGYELLFRSGFQNFFDQSIDGDSASSRVLVDTFLLMGLKVLTNGKPAFINFTRELLLRQVATLFPREILVPEILETLNFDPPLVEACRALKTAGYRLALDDFVPDAPCEPLLPYLDIIKVDFMLCEGDQRREIARRFRSLPVRLLAEKVETMTDFHQGMELGYSLFQGYFFSRPVIISGRDITGYKLNYLRILQEINRQQLDFNRLDTIIRQDVSLSYKLLRFINSAAFAFPASIQSIHQALTLLGEREFRKWASLVALKELGADKPEELVIHSIIRALFMETLATRAGFGDDAGECFLLGLFSLIDAFLDRPLDEILDELPLSDEIKTTLRGEVTRFHPVFVLGLAYETGDWEAFSRLVRDSGLSERDVPECFIRAVRDATRVYRA